MFSMFSLSSRDQYEIQPGAAQVCNSMMLICVAESVFDMVLLIGIWRIYHQCFSHIYVW